MAVPFRHPARHSGAALALVLLVACGGSGSGAPGPGAAPAPPAAQAPARPVSQTDLEIARLIYTDTQRTPAGFYHEPDPPWTGQVATFHVKNTDLQAMSAGAARHEACTDDWNQALGWSEQVAEQAPAYSDLIETTGNDRWYEFSRLVQGDAPRYLRMRVFRCSYLDREGVELGEDTGAAGTLNQRPINGPELAALSEYLWQFTPYNNFGHVVLASRGRALAGALQHELVIASLERGPSGGCDRIAVGAWTHSADVTSGELTLATTPQWSFRARENAGSTELCSG